MSLMAVLAGQAVAKEITIKGKLQKTVEAGGWLIVVGDQKFLILNVQRFQQETWFREGTEVEASGETKPDIVTTYMEGTPFEVRIMHAVATDKTGEGNTRSLTRITVTGDSIVQAQPDTASITVSVVTQSKSALDAQRENASKSDAVMRALKANAGVGAEIKTSGYSLQPQRMYRENQPPSITGYEARNSVTVTTSDLTRVGALIDAATQAGANDVTGISFSLKKDRPARDQALIEATREALAKAQVIAQALGGRVVRILDVQEESSQRPRPIYQAEAAVMRNMTVPSPPTPIEIGSLEVNSQVQLVAEVEAR